MKTIARGESKYNSLKAGSFLEDLKSSKEARLIVAESIGAEGEEDIQEVAGEQIV